MACTVFHLSLSSNFFQVSSSIEFIPPDSFFLASGIQTEKKALGKVAGFEQELQTALAVEQVWRLNLSPPFVNRLAIQDCSYA